MGQSVYVVGSGTYLPGDPIPFDSIDTVLGELQEAPARIRKWVKSTSRMMKEILDIKFPDAIIEIVQENRCRKDSQEEGQSAPRK